MDSLLIGGFVLLAIIIVTPFIAYTALRRTAELKDKVSDLSAETEELRRALKRYLAGEQVPETEIETVAVRAEPAPAPYSMQAVTEKAPPFATPVPVATPAPVTITKTAEPVNRPPVYDGNTGDIQERNNPAATIIQWLLNGNVLAKVGILLLFVGLSYLLKFSIENNMLTPEFRLIGAGTLSVVLFIAAWRVRDKNRLYSLIVQGGSLGAFYITIFAAYKLYQFLPPVFALLLMVIICMASVFFAVVQRAVSLAVLAVIGGYAAPVLLSTGSGNYIALFSYYLMLSVSILVMNHWQGWRLLNIIGFAFTFVIGVLWGVNNYQPEYYLSCQIFIILNLILYGLMTQQYARLHMQTDGDRKQLTVDSVLLFAPPILAFSLQYAITLPFYLGTAISSLSFGLIYMVLTVISLRRFREPGHRLSLGFLLLSTGFISLAVPLALSAQWTSVVWTIEGLAILWFACLQKQRVSVLSGTGLVLFGFASLLYSMDFIYWSQQSMWMYIFQWAGLLTAGALHHHYRLLSVSKSVSALLLVLAMIVWGLWLWMLPWLSPAGNFLSSQEHLLTGLVISVWCWYFLARRVQWTQLYYCIGFLWSLSLLAIIGDISIGNHPLGSVYGSSIWLLIIASMVTFIRLLPDNVPKIVRNLMHGATLWTLIGLLLAEVLWVDNRLPWGMDEWIYFINLLAICGIIFTLYILQHLPLPPMDKHAGLYWQCLYPLVVILVIMLISGNIQDGQLSLWTYIPLLNPLDEAGLFGIAALWSLRNALIRTRPKVRYRADIVRWLGFTVIALGIWWANGILIRALAFVDGTAWTSQALIQSRFIQTTLAIIWALTAVILMISATRYHKRYLWLAGAVTLTVVIIKLFVIDMNQSSGLARAIAFIGVALLILVVGYFSPLPPKVATGKYNNKEQNG
ncbi:DUF2339 domain-containing protein [Morganella psychrotolerans]|uniref:DUF2339 domain-containing protein n=1 Tax=Morganella psychrotolerans TaxID=368603 RepID=A0A1B8HQ38_9GAMM|nr:DUF2339 domain-containing protein [Morganella psychrotolerans]OBU11390.1 hypothetical protein AYY17_01195 [Morganella psychrotolerans]